MSICAWFLKCQFGSFLQTRKKSSLKQTWFFLSFKLDFYCLWSLQKSISKSNWFFNFFHLIFRNWKKIKWNSIFQKSSGDIQGVSIVRFITSCGDQKKQKTNSRMFFIWLLQMNYYAWKMWTARSQCFFISN